MIQTPERRSEPIICRPASVAEQIIIRDVEIVGEGDAAIDIAYPPVASWVWPTVTLENVTIRGDWHTLVRLRHCWNARLRNVMGAGLITHETIASPKAVYGFDLGSSMDVHMHECCMTCTQTGVYSHDGEGIVVRDGYYMNVTRGIHLQGDPTRRGRWGTPSAEIAPRHVAYLEHGALVSDYGGAVIRGDFYQSHVAVWGWGVYLVRCEDTRVTTRHWYNQPVRRGGAIVVEDCKTTLLDGNIVSDSMQIALIQQGQNTGTVLGTNQWGGRPCYPAL
jgi:hypothetical protein